MKVIKRLFPILVVLIITLSVGCGKSENRVSPPFFTVTDSETGGVVYMLGTMHVGLPNTVYSDEVFTALDECETLAVELDIQALESNTEELLSAMELLQCDSAEDFLGDDYAEIKDFFVKKRIYSANLNGYIPTVWSSTLSNKLAADCGYSSEYGTDRALLTYAKKNGIAIHEIESAAEQYRMNASEPRELQCYMLKSAVETDYELQKEQMKELYRVWSTADSAAIEQMLSDEGVPEELTEQYAEYYFAMYESRQRKMADYALETLRSGKKAFIAVGAMHYYAAPDIIDFLEDEGYTVDIL